MPYIGNTPSPAALTSEQIAPGAILYDDLNLALQQRLGSQGAISGDRNRVINGSCQIVNVATFVTTNNTGGYGGPEMFRADNNGAGGQFTQSQGSLSFGGLTLPTVRQTVNTAPTTITAGNFWHGILQNLEGFNVFDLRGKPVALSFVFNTNVSGTYSVALRDGPSTQSYVTTITAVANTPQQVTIPVAAIPAAASLPNSSAQGFSVCIGFLNTGTFQTATLNAWQSGNFVSAAGATNWGATAGNFIELTNLQLEEGTVATPFIQRSYGVELALTQRYAVFLDSGAAGNFLGVGIASSTTNAEHFVPFGARMRAIPSLLTTGVAADYSNSTGNNSSAATAVPSISIASITGARISLGSGAILTTNGVAALRANSVNAYLLFSARL